MVVGVVGGGGWSVVWVVGGEEMAGEGGWRWEWRADVGVVAVHEGCMQGGGYEMRMAGGMDDGDGSPGEGFAGWGALENLWPGDRKRVA